jgi:hypothetical protein
MVRGESKKQMGVALSDYLRGKLAVASEAANVSIAEEIRRRLERSFENDARDDSTQALVSAAIWIAGDITAQGTGAYWHATQKGRQAVAAGIRHFIEKLQPAVRTGGEDLFGPDDPETLGRASARHYIQMKQYQDEVEGPQMSQEDFDRLSRQLRKR